MVRILADDLQKDINAAEPTLLQAFFETTNPGNTRITSELGLPNQSGSAAKGFSGKSFGTLIAQTQSAVCGLQRAVLRESRGSISLPSNKGHPQVAALPEPSAPWNPQLARNPPSMAPVARTSDHTESAADVAHTSRDYNGRNTCAVAAVVNSAKEGVKPAEERGAAARRDAASESLLLRKLLAQPETSIATTEAATQTERGSSTTLDRRAVAMVDAAVVAAVTAQMRRCPTGAGTRLIYSRPTFEVWVLHRLGRFRFKICMLEGSNRRYILVGRGFVIRFSAGWLCQLERDAHVCMCPHVRG